MKHNYYRIIIKNKQTGKGKLSEKAIITLINCSAVREIVITYSYEVVIHKKENNNIEASNDIRDRDAIKRENTGEKKAKERKKYM